MNEETDNQIDPSVIDDMPVSVKRSLAEFINKRGGNIPVPEKKNTGVTNTRILRVVTGNLVKIQGQLTTIDNRLAQQNALIKSNLVTSVGMINAIEQRDNDLAQKFDELTAAFQAQTAFMEQQADLAEDRAQEARLEQQSDAAFTEDISTAQGRQMNNPVLKAIKRTFQRLGKSLSGILLRKGQGFGAKTATRLVKKAAINTLGKGIYRNVAQTISKTGVPGLGRAKGITRKGSRLAKAAFFQATERVLPLFVRGLLLADRIGTKRAASWFVSGTKSVQQLEKIKIAPKTFTKLAGKPLASTITKKRTTQIIADSGGKALPRATARAGKMFGRGGARGAGGLMKQTLGAMAGKKLTEGATEAAASAGVKTAGKGSTELLEASLKRGNLVQRALMSKPVQAAIAKKLGAEAAQKITTKLASKAVPGLGTIYGAVEGVARGIMGDWKGMMLSFGGAVPGVGVGFAMLDLFREIDIPAYEAHIEPNMPMPSDKNFADFFSTALGIGPDQYETGGLTKPGRAILHGTELVMDKDADPYQIFYRPVIRSLIGASTEYIQQAGPSASFIAPMFRQKANKLATEFGMETVSVATPGGGSLKGAGQRLDNFERKAEQQKEYYGPAGGPKGEDGEPQAQEGGLLGMIKRFFGFPVPEGEDRSSDFPSSTLPGAHDGGGTGPGDPNGGGKIAGDLGDHLKGMRTELPVTGQIHRHPRHPPYSMSSGHRNQSMHYSGRAIDIGGYSPSTPPTGQFPGATGADEQAPVLREIQKWNAAKGVTPVELVHGSPAFRGYGSYREYPDSHHHHVHIAYKNGGLTYDRPHIALMGEEGEEIVIPHTPSTGVARDLFLASSEAQSDTQVVAAIREYAPEILQYDEEGEDEQTMMMIAMPPQQQSQPTVERSKVNLPPSGGPMYGPEKTLVFQSLY